jgi:hypothetical protein
MVASPPYTVEILGEILATAATSGVFYTLPAGYRPVTAHDPCSAGATGGVPAGSAPYVKADTTGNLSMQRVTIGAANVYTFHGFVSLSA